MASSATRQTLVGTDPEPNPELAGRFGGQQSFIDFYHTLVCATVDATALGVHLALPYHTYCNYPSLPLGFLSRCDFCLCSPFGAFCTLPCRVWETHARQCMLTHLRCS